MVFEGAVQHACTRSCVSSFIQAPVSSLPLGIFVPLFAEQDHQARKASRTRESVLMFCLCGGGGRKDKTRKDFVSAVAGLFCER